MDKKVAMRVLAIAATWVTVYILTDALAERTARAAVGKMRPSFKKVGALRADIDSTAAASRSAVRNINRKAVVSVAQLCKYASKPLADMTTRMSETAESLRNDSGLEDIVRNCDNQVSIDEMDDFFEEVSVPWTEPL